MKPLLALLGLLACGLLARAEEDPAALVRKAVEHDRQVEARCRRYDYTLTETVEKLDRDGRVASRETTRETVRGGSPGDYDTRPDAPSREAAFNPISLVDHFRYRLAGRETVQGVDCYRIAYSPKLGSPYRNREEKVSNQLSGFLWIGANDASLMQNEGSLAAPVEIGWIFATLRKLSFRFEARRLPDGDWGPGMIRYHYEVAIPFAVLRQRHTRTMENYRLHP